MSLVVPVRLRYASQDYWFDPAGFEIHEGDHVLVETSRGSEIGLCTQEAFEVEDSDLKEPLKPVLRIATPEDFEKSEELAARAAQAMERFHELVQKHELDMSPTAVEFSFDESHATFYFTSDDRVDFRNLVRDLASDFHIRIDLRQIGSRDEARMLGGLGHCGEELCCARLGGEFQPVSIRMAKEQDLPLNPTKISGLCGRLMCCLRYEFEAYKDFKSRAPKKNGIIETPDGIGKVIEFDTPRENVRLRMEDGSTLVVPLAMLDTGDKVAREGERIRPCHISQENFDRIIEELNRDTTFAMMGEKLFSDDPDLEDATSSARVIESVAHPRLNKLDEGKSQKEHKSTGRKTRKRQEAAPAPKPRDERKRRRSVSASDGSTTQHEQKQEDSSPSRNKATQQSDERKPRRRRRVEAQSEAPARSSLRPRPGQHSSGVSGSTPKSRSSRPDTPLDADASSKNEIRRKRKRRGSRGRGTSGKQNGQGGAAE